MYFQLSPRGVGEYQQLSNKEGIERLVEASTAILLAFAPGPSPRRSQVAVTQQGAKWPDELHSLQLEHRDGTTVEITIRVDGSPTDRGVWQGEALWRPPQWKGPGGTLKLGVSMGGGVTCTFEGAPPPAVLRVLESIGETIAVPASTTELLRQARELHERYAHVYPDAAGFIAHLRERQVTERPEDLAALLASAANTGDLDRVEMLLEQGADPSLAVGHASETALHAAVHGGNRAIVDRLVAAGADIERADRYGRTSLMAAASHLGPLAARVVDALIEAGASIEARDERGMTALMIAVQHSQGVSELDLSDGVRREGDVEMVRRLLDHGADPNAPGPDGKSALDLAREWEKVPEVVEALAHGADGHPSGRR
jgi:ankyrin repeat protein